jgi:hypothetical protein
VWGDNLDSYDTDIPLPDQSAWEPWDGNPSAGDFYATTAQSQSEPNSLAINDVDDAVHQFSSYIEGVWEFTAWQYIPMEMVDEQYFILLNTYPASELQHWSIQIKCNGAEELITDPDSDSTLPMVKGQWCEIKVLIDLDQDEQSVYYNGEHLVTKSWTAGVADGGALNIAALDLYGAESASDVYYDEITLGEYSDPCPADINDDGLVNVDDLFALLNAWGSCDGCPEDINDDGFVNVDDLFELLNNWGPCP